VLLEQLEYVAELLVPHARSERIQLEVCTHPAIAWDYAQAHVLLSRLGYQDPSFDALLVRSLKAQACGGRERTPHRILEQEWIRVEDEEGRIHSLIHLKIEEKKEDRWCLWRPDQADFDSRSIFGGALVER
jgi:hypothetical protein